MILKSIKTREEKELVEKEGCKNSNEKNINDVNLDSLNLSIFEIPKTLTYFFKKRRRLSTIQINVVTKFFLNIRYIFQIVKEKD